MPKSKTPPRPEPDKVECRVCLKHTNIKQSLNILEHWASPFEGANASIAEDFTKITGIQISNSDEYTKYICRLCYEKLKHTLIFISMAKKSDKKLRSRCKLPAAEWPQPILVDKFNYDVEIKQEALSDDETNEVPVEEEQDDFKMDIKVEPEEYLDATPNIQLEGAFSLADELEEQLMVNGIKDTNDERSESEVITISVVKEEPPSEDDKVTHDLPLECMLCMKNFNSVSGLKAHVIVQHSYQTVGRTKVSSPTPKTVYYYCSICRRKFQTRTDLIVHETCHAKYSCYVCNSKFDSFRQLTKHRNKCGNENTKPRLKTLEDVKRNMPLPPLKQPETQTIEMPQIKIRNISQINEITDEKILEQTTVPEKMEITIEIYKDTPKEDSKPKINNSDKILNEPDYILPDQSGDDIPKDNQTDIQTKDLEVHLAVHSINEKETNGVVKKSNVSIESDSIENSILP